MYFYLDNILNPSTEINLNIVSTIVQIQEQLDSVIGYRIKSELEFDEANLSLQFLAHAEKQLTRLLSRENESGFELAAHMTLTALGSVVMENDKESSTNKSAVKGRLAKVKDAIVKLIKRIKDALINFLKGIFDKVTKLIKGADAVSEKSKEIKSADSDKEIELYSIYGDNIPQLEKSVASWETVKAELVVSFGANLAMIDPEGVKEYMSNSSQVKDIRKAVESVQYSISEESETIVFIPPNFETVTRKGVTFDDVKTAGELAAKISTHLKRFNTLVNMLESNKEVESNIAKYGLELGQPEHAKLSILAYTVVLKAMVGMKIDVSAKLLKNCLAFVSAGKA